MLDRCNPGFQLVLTIPSDADRSRLIASCLIYQAED